MAGLEQDPPNVIAANTERVELSAPLGPFLSLLRAALTQEPSRISEMRPSVIGVQFEGQVVLRARQAYICRRKRRVLVDGLLKVGNAFFHSDLVIAVVEHPSQIALLNIG